MWPFKREKRSALDTANVPLSAENIWRVFGLDQSKISVTPDTALSVPAVWAAVNFISNTVVSLPLQLYRRTDDGREKASSDPLYSLLHDLPNPEWTSHRWRKYTMTQTLTHGRSYTYIQRGGNGHVMGLWPMDPNRTTAKRAGLKTVYEYREGADTLKTYESSEVIDIPFMLSSDQVTHVKPTERLRGAVALAIALQRYAEQFFSGGGVPPLSLEGPFNSPEAVTRASKDVTDAIRNAVENGRLVLPMPMGHSMKQIGFNPEQGQLVEARRFSLEEIARVYNLSPIFLQDLSHGTFANTEQQDLHVIKHTISHWLNEIEQEINAKLFGRNRTRYVEFNVDGLLRGDFGTRMEGYAKGIQNSILTPNEVRQKENNPPMDGGDQLFLQQNMSELQSLQGRSIEGER
ncbi:MAG: phage portal protein [bacterium]